MAILIWWREIIISLLVAACLWLVIAKQDVENDLQETTFKHEQLVKQAELNAANIIITVQRQRQLDAENYANEINRLNDRYATTVASTNRMQQTIAEYNTRLETLSRETVENYAKVGTTLYNECRKEYLDLGYYAARLDAELDKVTTTKPRSK